MTLQRLPSQHGDFSVMFTAVKNCSILHGRVFVMVNLFISHPFLGSPSWMLSACSSVHCCVDTFGQRHMDAIIVPKTKLIHMFHNFSRSSSLIADKSTF